MSRITCWTSPPRRLGPSLGAFILLVGWGGLRGEEPPGSTWPHFLARQVDATVSLPASWTPESVAWTTEIDGWGQSSPVVWGDAIYVTSVDGPSKDRLIVTRLDGHHGAIQWSVAVPSTNPVPSTRLVSHAAPTPVVDADGVYAFFESGDLLAVGHDGNARWQAVLTERHGAFDNKFGLAASPVQTEDRVIVLLDHDGPSCLTAIAKEDGRTLWTVPRAGGRSWSSPGLITVDGAPQVVCSSIGDLSGYDVRTGQRLWTIPEVGGNTAATPLNLGEGQFLIASLVRPIDGPVEFATRSNGLVQVRNEARDGGSKSTADLLWRAEAARGSFCSPIADDDLAYWVSPVGVVAAVDRADGSVVFQQRLPCGACWATPMRVGPYLYFFGKDGVTTTIRAGRTFEIVSAESRLWPDEPTDRPTPPNPSNASPTDPAIELESATPASPPTRATSPSEASSPIGPTQYAAVLGPGGLIVRSEQRLYAVPFGTPPTETSATDKPRSISP